jgi:hypothetical protein
VADDPVRCGTGGGNADATRESLASPPPAGPATTGSREMTAAGRPAPEARARSGDRRGGARVGKPAGDGRMPPRSKSGEPRRGGVGALIGITFA